MLVTELDITIDYNKLQHEYNLLKIDQLLKNSRINQIAVQCIPGCPIDDQLYQGTGSLMYDWNNLDKNGNPYKRHKQFRQFDFIETNNYFKNTYIEEIINLVSDKYKICRTRFIMSEPKTCLSTHSDPTRRIHIPIYTNNDCYMVFTDKVYRLDHGKIYITNTTEEHTAVNASNKTRTHLVMCVDEDVE